MSDETITALINYSMRRNDSDLSVRLQTKQAAKDAGLLNDALEIKPEYKPLLDLANKAAQPAEAMREAYRKLGR